MMLASLRRFALRRIGFVLMAMWTWVWRWALIENHMRFADAERMKPSTLKRFFRLEEFPQHLALHKMDCMAASGNLDHWSFVRERYEAMPEEAVRPVPLLTGRELIAAGYEPGPRFKEILHAVEDAQLEGAIHTL